VKAEHDEITRDFRAELGEVRCWDAGVQAVFDERGEPVVDCSLQNREELIGLCEFIARHHIRSYLEIGTWTGGTVRALHRLFDFDTLAVCDHGWVRSLGLEVRLPAAAQLFEGDSDSDDFLRWREALGPIDLVMIDANHRYHAVRRDLEINRRFPHRFLAFHDITGANRHTTGVRRLWSELTGWKHEICRPHTELGLDHSVMGIGIWAASAPVELP
jgi:hypothetical protein